MYNVEKYVGRCIKSVLLQTYSNIELIVIDDRGTDNSIKVINDTIVNLKTNFNIKIITHDKNRGLSAARETGVKNASGMYIMHLDSDDYIEPNTVEDCVKSLHCPETDIVLFGTTHEYDDNKKSTDLRVCHFQNKEQYLSDVIIQNVPTNIWGKLIKKSLYTDHDIHAIESISYAEDYAVLPRLLWYAGSIEILPKPHYHYVHYNVGSFTNVFKDKNIFDCFVAEQCIESFFDGTMYDVSLKIAHNRRYAWALRQIYENNKDKKEFPIGENRYIFSERKNYSLNHNVILFLDKMGLTLACKAYTILSSLMFKKIKRKR